MTWTAKTERCAFLVENLDLTAATGYDGARWEHFQLAHLQDDAMFRCEVKSRQIAWSWLSAAEAVADGILDGSGSVFVSINLDEAKEKIRYAHAVIGALPVGLQPRIVTDNRTELEFANGARLLSLPATAPRGKAQMNVYLDEFAHVRDDALIYTAALPMITKGRRRLRMASSPMGASGRFWEVATEALRPYKGYARKRTPWWEVYAFCTDVASAVREAPGMETADRVARFGNERIQAIFANMPVEDFQQEYECDFVDESTAWITWEEIRDVQNDGLVCVMVAGSGTELDSAFSAIDEIAGLVASQRVESYLAAGLDVGRTRNTTELFVTGLSTVESYPLRLAVTLDGVSFDGQRDVVSYAMEQLPILGLFIDRNGIGRNLAETMEAAFPGRAVGMDFTGLSKQMWATDAKTLVQQHKTPLPADRELAYQIHSIKRIVSQSRNLIFDTARNEKHHADKFWAWALALAAAKTIQAPSLAPQIVIHEEAVTISPY